MFTLVWTRTSSLFLQSRFVLGWPPGCVVEWFYSISDAALWMWVELCGFPISVHFSSLFLSKTAAQHSNVSTVLPQFVFLSDNLLIVQSVPLPRSLTRMLNSSGTSISPWGMPPVIYCELRLIYWSQHADPAWTLVLLFFHSPLSTYLYLTNRDCVKGLAQFKVWSIQCSPMVHSTAGYAWYAFCKSGHLLLRVLWNGFKEDCLITFPEAL